MQKFKNIKVCIEEKSLKIFFLLEYPRLYQLGFFFLACLDLNYKFSDEILYVQFFNFIFNIIFRHLLCMQREFVNAAVTKVVMRPRNFERCVAL